MKYLAIITLLLSCFASAEIEKQAYTCEANNGICFLWWPKLPQVTGWAQDLQHSHHYKMNTQAPTGFTFSNAETVIYARAEYQQNNLPDNNIADFIKFSQEQFLKPDPSIKVSEAKILNSQSKILFKSYKFTPANQGNWEQVSYAEETDNDGNKYYLIFVLSSRSEAGYNKNIDSYFKFISLYK